MSAERITYLEEILKLEKEYERLTSRRAKVEERLNELRQALPPLLLGKKQGTICQKVMVSLTAAGEKGVRVSELVKMLDVNANSLRVWFCTHMKKLPELQRLGPGHYALTTSKKN